MPMKKGQEVIGIVDKVDFPNRGVVRVTDGEDVCYVKIKNVICQQKLRIRITKKRHGEYEGKVLEVLEKSPWEREEHPCSHFPECGGCLYQTIRYQDQLRMKEEQIRDLLSPVIGARYDAVYEGISPSPIPKEYRNKMELTFGDNEKDGELMLGMHKRGSFYDIVPTMECLLMDEDMREIHKRTLLFFREKGTAYYHKRTHQGYLRHLLLRKAKKTGEILVDLVTSTDVPSTCVESTLLLEWKERILDGSYDGRIVGILHTRNDRQADVVCDEGTDVLFGTDLFEEKLLGLSFAVTPFSFFQTNTLGAEVLYDKVRKMILDVTKADHEHRMARIYDFYSGTGTITQIMSAVAMEAVGVEFVPEAVRAAEKNAKKNGISNCRFICGDVLKVLDDLSEKPDFIILDPPRDGIHPRALPKIIAYGVEHILYISCKATSLARDLPVFFEAGYEAECLALVDMFPSTGGIETICLLSQRNPDDSFG